MHGAIAGPRWDARWLYGCASRPMSLLLHRPLGREVYQEMFFICVSLYYYFEFSLCKGFELVFSNLIR